MALNGKQPERIEGFQGAEEYVVIGGKCLEESIRELLCICMG